ncbi:hypothetical protein [Pseudomonas citri]|uniref:hypothetical protein n=1 Tax=Pseudomonas citri TaxID=2978349 RepID=UPI0021B621A8|nr:hypothetical protein [Pseudomonas citri]
MRVMHKAPEKDQRPNDDWENRACGRPVVNKDWTGEAADRFNPEDDEWQKNSGILTIQTAICYLSRTFRKHE